MASDIAFSCTKLADAISPSNDYLACPHADCQRVGASLMRCARQITLEGQDLSCTYPAHHELESDFIIVHYHEVLVICYYSPLLNICNLSIITT